jgi:TRAP-type C4-dicarboxylate transport system substrate-binding protein
MKESRFMFGLMMVLIIAFFPLTIMAKDTASSKPIELRLAHMMPINSPSHHHIEAWAKKIEKESMGRLKIRIFPASTLVKGPEIYDAVKIGTVDLGFSWRYKPAEYTLGVTFPFTLDAPDTRTASRIYDDVWKKFPDAMGKEWKDVKVLYLVPSVANHICSRKPIHSCDDIKGQQLRVPSPYGAQFVQELGGTAVFMPAGDFSISVEKGVVDGGFLLSSMVKDFKLGGKIKYFVMNPVGFATPVFLAMNKKAYGKLPGDLKAVLDKSREWAKNDALDYWDATFTNAKKYFESTGVEMVHFTGGEKQKMNAAYQKVCNQVGKSLDAKGYPGTELIKYIRERMNHYGQ